MDRPRPWTLPSASKSKPKPKSPSPSTSRSLSPVSTAKAPATAPALSPYPAWVAAASLAPAGPVPDSDSDSDPDPDPDPGTRPTTEGSPDTGTSSCTSSSTTPTAAAAAPVHRHHMGGSTVLGPSPSTSTITSAVPGAASSPSPSISVSVSVSAPLLALPSSRLSQRQAHHPRLLPASSSSSASWRLHEQKPSFVQPDTFRSPASSHIQTRSHSQTRGPPFGHRQDHSNRNTQPQPAGLSQPTSSSSSSNSSSSRSDSTSVLDSIDITTAAAAASVASNESGATTNRRLCSDISAATPQLPPAAPSHAVTTSYNPHPPPSRPLHSPRPLPLQPNQDGASSAAELSSPSMSHHPPSAGHSRQHQQQSQSPQNGAPPPQPQHQQQQVSYPPSHHYPHHGAPSGHPPPQYGYAPTAGQPVDQYRQSPTGPPPHALALPSMRSFDQQQAPQGQPPHSQHHQQPQQHFAPVQQHPQQQHPHAYPPQLHIQPGAPIGSTMAPGPHMGYFSIQPNPYAMHDPMAMRYGLPPGLYDPRMQLSGGRHKKEIKRRTKTGCLTCRKRRIKCDETHPTCNNCKKSKRECLGYDPIFKQQQAPSALQPAPNGDISPTSTTASTAASTTPAPYTTHPTPVLTPSDPPSATRDSSEESPVIKSEPSDTDKASANIDPALVLPHVYAGAATATSIDAADSITAAGSSAQQTGKAMQLRGGGSPFSSTSSSASFPSPLPINSTSTSAHAYSTCPVKMKVDDVIAMAGAPPPETKLMPTPQSVEELTKIYYEIYVPGLCSFFESQWFNFKSDGHNSIYIFLHDRPLISLLGSFLVSLHTVNSDPSHTPYCGHLETRVVWALAKLAYTIPPGSNMPRDDPLPEDNASEVRNRVLVFETLLTGDSLPSNPLIPPPKNADQQRRKEYEFWYSLAEFMRLQDFSEREQHLRKLRTLLDGRENRDVLYSLAIIRQLSPYHEPGWENRVPDHLNEKEPLNQLHVAIRFIKAEASATGGSTNVVRQFSSVAMRSLITPGFNIERKR